MADSLAGSHALVTGAASGIGRAVALQLAGAGATLYLTDINPQGLADTVADARALGAEVAEHRALDIADYDAVAGFAADVHDRHRAMDLVFNIAGVSAWGSVEELTHRQWRSMVDVNLMGPIHVIETFVPPMVAAANVSTPLPDCAKLPVVVPASDWAAVLLKVMVPTDAVQLPPIVAAVPIRFVAIPVLPFWVKVPLYPDRSPERLRVPMSVRLIAPEPVISPLQVTLLLFQSRM